MAIILIAIIAIVIVIAIIASNKAQETPINITTVIKVAEEAAGKTKEEIAFDELVEEATTKAMRKEVKNPHNNGGNTKYYAIRRKDARWRYGHKSYRGSHDYKYKDKRIDNGKRQYDLSWEKI